MWLNYLPTKWLRAFLGWFTGKNDKEQVKELKESITEEPVLKEPAPPIRKGSLEDIRDYCNEMRKTLRTYKGTCEKMCETAWTHKKTIDEMYVEVGNLRDKIERYLEGRKEG